jgi:hypothetical protein
MYRWSCLGDLLGSKRRSKPLKMADRSASLRKCFTTASGRESFPRSADPQDQLKHAPHSVSSSRPAGRPDTQPLPSGRRSDRQQDPQRPARNQQSPVGAPRQLNGPRSASSAPPVDVGNRSRRCLCHVVGAEESIGTAHGRQQSRRRLRAHAATNRRFQLHSFRKRVRSLRQPSTHVSAGRQTAWLGSMESRHQDQCDHGAARARRRTGLPVRGPSQRRPRCDRISSVVAGDWVRSDEPISSRHTQRDLSAGSRREGGRQARCELHDASSATSLEWIGKSSTGGWTACHMYDASTMSASPWRTSTR